MGEKGWDKAHSTMYQAIRLSRQPASTPTIWQRTAKTPCPTLLLVTMAI